MAWLDLKWNRNIFKPRIVGPGGQLRMAQEVAVDIHHVLNMDKDPKEIRAIAFYRGANAIARCGDCD